MVTGAHERESTPTSDIEAANEPQLDGRGTADHATSFNSPRELRHFLRARPFEQGPPRPPSRRDLRLDAGMLARPWTWVCDLFALSALLAVTFWIGWTTFDFRGFPKGYDALGHISYARLLINDFPNFTWNSAWYAGVQGIPGIYGPAYHVLLAGLASATASSLETAMVQITAAMYLLGTASIYAFVRLVTSSRSAAMVSSLLLLATPALWAQSLSLGEYARLLAVVFILVSMAAIAWYARSPSRPRFMLIVLAVSISLLSHQEAGAFCEIIAVSLMVTYVPGRLDARLARAFWLAVATIGTTAFFYFPVLLDKRPVYLQDPGSAFNLTHNPTVPLNAVFGFRALFFTGLAFGTVGAVVILLTGLIVSTIRHRAPLRPDHLRLRLARAPDRPSALWITIALLIVPIMVLLYSLPNLSPTAQLNIASFKPKNLLVVIAGPLCAIVGIAGFAVVRYFARPVRMITAVIGVGAAAVVVATIVPSFSPPTDGSLPPHAQIVSLLPHGANGEQQYRVGGVTDVVTDWINSVTATPQIRGYIEQQIPHHDWEFWLETTLGSNNAPLAERQFLFNWYAIKWFYAGPGNSVIRQYTKYPALFTTLGATTLGDPYQVVQYTKPQPVATATASPAALIITPDRTTYDYALRAFGLSGNGPDSVIPVEGGANLDSYSYATLEHFASIMLYGPLQLTNPDIVAATLRRYVAGGGHLYISASGNETTLNALYAAGAPVAAQSTQSVPIKNTWDFTIPAGGSPTLLSQLKTFAPPAPRGQLWNIDSATGVTLGASVQAYSHGLPVLVTEPVGLGSVVWEGLNLPFHIAVTRKQSEANLMAELAGVHPGAATATTISAHIAATGPVSVTAAAGSSGVLLKQNLFPNWKVTVDGSPATIYPAGPGMMFVPLSARFSSLSRAPHTVTFTYVLSTIQRGSIVISIVATIVILALLTGLPTKKMRRRMTEALRRRDLVV